MREILLLTLFFLSSCKLAKQPEADRLKRKNAVAEYITRKDKDSIASQVEIKQRDQISYSWEEKSNLPRITKEFFLCRGSVLNPPRKEKGQVFEDCEGALQHGFPSIHGEKGVYPVLIEILNYLQKKTQKRVVITCGHRCLEHELYASPTHQASSKHLLGAEVDFYLQTMEENPLEVIELIFQFFRDNRRYRKDLAYQTFYSESETSWFNKEILVKVTSMNEEKDFDNRHPFSYITIELLYDLVLKQPL